MDWASWFFCLSSLLGPRPEELWGTSSGEGKTQRSLWEARLFPVFQPRSGAVGLEGVTWLMSGSPGDLEWWRGAWRLCLREVLSLTDQEGELRWREELFLHAARRRAADTLKGHSDHSLLPSIRAAVLGGQQGELLSALDRGEEWGTIYVWKQLPNRGTIMDGDVWISS